MFDGVKGFLFDIDGVLVTHAGPIPGAIETLNLLERKGIPFRLLTNRTTRGRESLTRRLREIGLPVEREHIFSAPEAALHYLRALGRPRITCVLQEDVKGDFSEFPHDDINPEFIVIGDLGDDWNFPTMNRLFRMVMNGAQMLALHKGRFFPVEDGLRMDIGAWISGLEYVSGREALILGKPAGAFFRMALDDMGVAPGEAVMIGDDIVADIGGAQTAGVRAILAMTGKFHEGEDRRYGITPDGVIASVAVIRNFLQDL